jgi:serine/threonine-protein kinase
MMKPERWEETERLYHAALELSQAERIAFLREACKGDDALFSEVESLLRHQEKAEHFIEEPALEIAAKHMAEDQVNSMLGRQLGSYKILSRLGAGGMGEVYLAEDASLNRKVAIKLILAGLTADEQAQRRLKREAKAAAALDHPNICSIYEVGQQDNINYIVMQYVEGETLASRIQTRPPGLADSLEIAIQIAGALSAAHSQNIIHRDIKPENIIINSHGQLKVLDFGLAKAVDAGKAFDNEGATEDLLSVPGMLMGTPAYMSPEQVRGETLDGRSDIFSFGVVLYEMVSRVRPFAGESLANTISAILTHEPQPLARYSREVPAEMERIVSKLLRKDREERYQSAKDLLIDLRRLKQRVEFEAELARSTGPYDQTQTTATITKSSGPGTALESSGPTGESVAMRQTAAISPAKRQKRTVGLILVLLVAAIGGMIYLIFESKLFGSDRHAIESIAVLPFVNASSDAENEYLSDGITESLINSLSQVPNLKVRPRNSVLRFKGPDTDAKAAGTVLGVSAVLTGRVTQRGQDLIISAALIDVRDNSNLWGEQYSRRLSDLVTVQAEIVKQIFGTLRVRLPGAEQSRVTKRYTENPEANRLYLQGRFFWLKFNPADHQRAADYFNQAIANDPNYALAYAGLADTYIASAANAWIAPSDAYPKAKAAARKALDLGETLPEAHLTWGVLSMFYDYDWAAAEREYKRGIELNPNYPGSYEIYTQLLGATGRLDEALEMAKRGLNADPLSVLINDDMSYVYYYLRRYDEGIKQYQKSLEMDPNDTFALLGLGAIYEQKGMYDEAIAAYQKSINLTERTTGALGVLGHAYAASGRRAEALKILAELNEMSRQKYVSPFDLAVLYTGLGEKDRAIEQLQKQYQERGSGLFIDLKVEPLFDPLRSDPRFGDILQRMGLGN